MHESVSNVLSISITRTSLLLQILTKHLKRFHALLWLPEAIIMHESVSNVLSISVTGGMFLLLILTKHLKRFHALLWLPVCQNDSALIN
jgi:hypothetical protein